MAEINATAAASSSSSSTNNVSPGQASVNSREMNTNTTTITGGSGGNNRKTFTIPKLDEKQLEIKFSDHHNSGSTFVVAEGGPSNTTTEVNSVPLNSNAPAFVIGAGSLYANANMLVDSPSSNSAYLSLLQQQSLQYQMHQVSSAEQELYLTREMLQQCPHPVLVMVLSSLVEENPAICPFVRQRCERAAIILSQQQQAAAAMAAAAAAANSNNNNSNNNNNNNNNNNTGVNSNNNNNSNSNNNGNNGRYSTPWGSHTVSTSNYESPRPAASYTSSASPHAGSTRKGRGNRSREEGVCSVHNSVRSMNHLQLNKQTGLHECVHGFHCLEDGGSAAVTPSNFNNSAASPSHTKVSLAPSRDNHSNTNYSNSSSPAMKINNNNSNLNLHGANNNSNHSHGNNNNNNNNNIHNNHNNHNHIIITSNNNNNNNNRNHINGGSKFGSNINSHGGECIELPVMQEERSKNLFQVLNDSADMSSGFDVLNSILQSVREIAEEEGNLDEPVR